MSALIYFFHSIHILPTEICQNDHILTFITQFDKNDKHIYSSLSHSYIRYRKFESITKTRENSANVPVLKSSVVSLCKRQNFLKKIKNSIGSYLNDKMCLPQGYMDLQETKETNSEYYEIPRTIPVRIEYHSR